MATHALGYTIRCIDYWIECILLKDYYFCNYLVRGRVVVCGRVAILLEVAVEVKV